MIVYVFNLERGTVRLANQMALKLEGLVLALVLHLTKRINKVIREVFQQNREN